MSVRTDLFSYVSGVSAVTNLLGASPTRFYWQQLPQGVTYPACRYFIVSSVPSIGHDGTAAHAVYRVQVDVFDTDDSGAESVVAALKAGMNGIRSGSLTGMKLISESDAYEEADDQYRISTDWLIHHVG